MTTFRAAVEAGDMAAAVALLAEDVEFHSPVVHTPYRGRDAVAPILHAVATVLEDFQAVAAAMRAARGLLNAWALLVEILR